MCLWRPSIEYQTDRETVKALLASQFQGKIVTEDERTYLVIGRKAITLKLRDRFYYSVGLADWYRIFKSVLMNIPRYIGDRFDCDNFAGYTQQMIAAKFKLNGCGVASGWARVEALSSGVATVSQPHEWNIFIDSGKFRYLDAQTGLIYETTEPDLDVAEEIRFG